VFAAAQRQQGVVTTTQLLAAGWDKDAIARRVARGYLRRLHHGVYLVGPLAAEHAAAMAAVLATDGVVSHYPAAVLWGWRPQREGPMHVIAGGRNHADLVVHHTALDPRDITRRHGIPVTSAARTLLDLAATEPTAELDRALNEAGLQRRVSPHSLNEQFSRYPRHRGTAALKKAITTEPRLTRSDLERIALGLIRRARLPEPETNISSWAFHSMRSSFEQDRRRDQRLTTAGYRVIRITDRQLTYEPELVVATLTQALALPR
jgi:hypothetical protein